MARIKAEETGESGTLAWIRKKMSGHVFRELVLVSEVSPSYGGVPFIEVCMAFFVRRFCSFAYPLLLVCVCFLRVGFV